MVTPDINADRLRGLAERVAAIEQQIKALGDQILSGDNSVRQGVENVKYILLKVQEEVGIIKNMMLSKDAQEALYGDIRELKTGVHHLERQMNAHKNDHALTKGEQTAMDNLKSNWVIPVTTAVLIALILAGLRTVGIS